MFNKILFAILNKRYSIQVQYISSILLVLIVSTISFISKGFIGYHIVALVLLVTVSLLAMVFDILPVLVASILSALSWNFFFIPPTLTFHIDNAEDLLMFAMYFFIALVNAVLTSKIREQEKSVRDKDEKENTIKLYDALLNSLSHELRTPLATIMGSVDTLKENRLKISEHNQNLLLSEIDIATNRLNRQVENLLNMSRLQSGMLHLQYDWCDVNELVYSVIYKLPHNSHNVVFIPNEQLPFFKLDSGLIEQVLYNIVHNAIQYTPSNTTISISTDLQDGSLMIIIADDGQGFSEDEIGKVFDKFYRVPKTKVGGTGLGLSIAKGFVSAHNGQLTLENIATGGAKFTILIQAQTSYINNLKNE